MQLTSVQEAGFNAAAEAARDLGIDFHLHFAVDGTVSAFGYIDGTYHTPMINSGGHSTAAEAVADFLAKLEKAKSEPQPLRRPSEVVAAVRKLVPEIVDDRVAGELLLSRIESIPVKD